MMGVMNEAQREPMGLRERKKAMKRERIMAEAARLFAEKGYEAVTTAEIADAAQVGTGTLFRYVGSKAELLVAVMNDRLVEGMADGLARARQGDSVESSVLAILKPLAEESIAHPENMIAYEREALFGANPSSASAATSISAIEGAILEILELHGAKPRNATVRLEDIAHTIYATLFVDIVKVGVGHTDIAELPQRVRYSVDMLINALLEP